MFVLKASVSIQLRVFSVVELDRVEGSMDTE